MSMQDHGPTPLGRWFLWGGLALGVLFVVAVFTRGFGLIGPPGTAQNDVPAAVHNTGARY